MNTLEFRLLNDFQRDFPLCERPYLELAQRLDMSEQWVLSSLARLQQKGVVGRVGATFAPNTVGTSTLAALEVATTDLERVGNTVNGFPGVNHNYLRSHAINLWFVVTAPDAAHLSGTLADIERTARSGTVLSLPLISEYRIDLGFDLGSGCVPDKTARAAAQRISMTANEQHLIAALAQGLLLVPRPFVALAACCACTQSEVLATLRQWQDLDIIRRFGVIVRHRPLGFCANAMVVWDVPDELVDSAGAKLAADAQVSLCYRRARSRPRWPYNLFCMLHGRERDEVSERARRLAVAAGLDRYPCELLFSQRSFKQTGANYATSAQLLHA